MIAQGFPLWAVDEDGVTYAVIGWTDAEPRKYPVMVTLAGLVRPVAAEEGPATGLLTFTTTDPGERPEPDTLRARMAALADNLEQIHPGAGRAVAESIRAELDK